MTYYELVHCASNAEQLMEVAVLFGVDARWDRGHARTVDLDDGRFLISYIDGRPYRNAEHSFVSEGNGSRGMHKLVDGAS